MSFKTNALQIAVMLAAIGQYTVIGDAPPADLRAKVEAKVKELQSWSKDQTIVSAVKAYNAKPPADLRQMTNDRWKSLSILDPTIRSLTNNQLAEHLKTKKDDQMTECFVSAADGTKVAFLTKTSAWSHKDKPKHAVPMTGKTWIGPVEVDESTGQQQIQVAVPVLDGTKPIGSIVIGLGLNRLR
jgi:hypothetical protein